MTARLPRASLAVACVLILVPLSIAFLGPFAPLPERDIAVPSDPASGGPLGTDFAGRDVLRLTLDGGYRAILVALAATAAIQVLGLAIGLLAGMTRRPWLDELLMRPWDVVLSIPTLLLVITAAALSEGHIWPLAAVVTLVGTAECARMTRAACRQAATRPVVEAMRLGGERWARIALTAVLPEIWLTLLSAACLQLCSALSLVATASFLGAGISPQDADWATMIETNRSAMALQPWAVLAPCLLLAALVIGVNLLAGRVDRHAGSADVLARLESEARA